MNQDELRAFAEQKQRIMAIIAEQIEQAKVILMDARQIANDAGIEFSIDTMIYEVNNGGSWYNSNLAC